MGGRVQMAMLLLVSIIIISPAEATRWYGKKRAPKVTTPAPVEQAILKFWYRFQRWSLSTTLNKSNCQGTSVNSEDKSQQCGYYGKKDIVECSDYDCSQHTSTRCVMYSIMCDSGPTINITWDYQQFKSADIFLQDYVTEMSCTQFCNHMNGSTKAPGDIFLTSEAATTRSASSSEIKNSSMDLSDEDLKDKANNGLKGENSTPVIVGVIVSVLVAVTIVVVVVVFLLYRKRKAGLCKGESGPVNGHMNNSYTGVDTCRHGNTVNNMEGSNDRTDMNMTNINTSAHYDNNIRSNNDSSSVTINSTNNDENPATSTPTYDSLTTPAYDSLTTPTNDNPHIPTLASTPTLAHLDQDTNDMTRPAPLYSRLNEEPTRTRTNLYNVGPDNSTHVYSKLAQDQGQQKVLDNTYDVQPSRGDDNLTSTSTDNPKPTSENSQGPSGDSPSSNYSLAQPLNQETIGHPEPDTSKGSTIV